MRQCRTKRKNKATYFNQKSKYEATVKREKPNHEKNIAI
jgi:hypothetical protein